MPKRPASRIYGPYCNYLLHSYIFCSTVIWPSFQFLPTTKRLRIEHEMASIPSFRSAIFHSLAIFCSPFFPAPMSCHRLLLYLLNCCICFCPVKILFYQTRIPFPITITTITNTIAIDTIPTTTTIAFALFFDILSPILPPHPRPHHEDP